MSFNMSMSCLPHPNSPQMKGLVESSSPLQTMYSMPLNIYSDSDQQPMPYNMDYHKTPAMQNLAIEFHRSISIGIGKYSSPLKQPQDSPTKMQINNRIAFPYCLDNMQPDLPIQKIMSHNISSGPIHWGSSNAFFNCFSNEWALDNSSQNSINKNSKLDPNSPPFHSQIFKMHKLNPEAAEYIPRSLQNSKKLLPSEIECKNHFNTCNNCQVNKEPCSKAKELSNSGTIEAHEMDDFNRTAKEEASFDILLEKIPRCSSPKHDTSELSDNMAVQPVLSLTIISENSLTSDFEMTSDDEEEEESFDASCSNKSFEEDSKSNCKKEFSSDNNSSGQSLCRRSLSESSVDSSDSFQIEFGDYDSENESNQFCESGSKTKSQYKCSVADIFASQSSDEDSDFEYEDDDSVDGNYTDAIFDLDCDDAWKIKCHLDINNLSCTPVKSEDTKSSKGSCYFPEAAVCDDVCNSAKAFRTINERWNSEITKECKGLTPAKVRFLDSIKVYPMIVWNYAYQAARKGPWMEAARDRDRFRLRIERAGEVLNPVLDTAHRQKMFQLINSNVEKT